MHEENRGSQLTAIPQLFSVASRVDRQAAARIKNLEGNGSHLKVAHIGVIKGEVF